MKSFKSHKKCSWVEISNFNNLCSIHCRDLKFGTHEEELEPILLTNFQQKVQNLFHRNRTLLGVFFCVCLFSGFFDLVAKQKCLQFPTAHGLHELQRLTCHVCMFAELIVVELFIVIPLTCPNRGTTIQSYSKEWYLGVVLSDTNKPSEFCCSKQPAIFNE